MQWLDQRKSSAAEDEDRPEGGVRFALGTGEMPGLERAPLGETRFTRELEKVPDAAFALDHRGLIVEANAHAQELLARSRDDLIGRSFAEVLSAPHVEVFANRIGKHVRFLPASAGMTVHGREVDVLVCPHDTRASIAIVRTAVASDARLREDDVAQIVHDLKSPLSLIALEADLLDHRLDAGDHGDVKYAVARILRNAAFLDRMVHDLLDLCSLEAGQLELHRVPTELRTLLETVIDRVVGSRERARVFIEAHEHVTLEVDDMRIERVVANFLSNALKYSPSSSGIVVRLDRRPHAAHISVIDSGPGLTPAEMAHVFEKYRRARTVRDSEGTGLGLFVSKQIVEAHGGVIGVDSVHGVGSRFFFELPC